jgi:hypothetical protein
MDGVKVPVSANDMQLALEESESALAAASLNVLEKARSPLELRFAQRLIKRQDTPGLIGSIIKSEQQKSQAAAAKPPATPQAVTTQKETPTTQAAPPANTGSGNSGGTNSGTTTTGNTDTGNNSNPGTNNTPSNNNINNINNNDPGTTSSADTGTTPTTDPGSNGLPATSGTPTNNQNVVNSIGSSSYTSSSTPAIVPLQGDVGSSASSSAGASSTGTPWDAGANTPGALTASPSSSMNSGAVGAGVGVTVGVLALLALLFCLRRRRQRKTTDRHAEWTAGAPVSRGPPSEKASSKPSSKQSAGRSLVGWITNNRSREGSTGDRQSTHSSFASPLAPNRPSSNFSDGDPFSDKSPESSSHGHGSGSKEKDPFVDTASTASRPNSEYESTQMSMSPVMFADVNSVEPWIHRGVSMISKDAASPRSSTTSHSRTVSVPPASYNNKKLRRSVSTYRSSVGPIGDHISVYPDDDGRYTVQRPFTPTLADELAVSAGDMIKVVKAFDDGWAFCVKADGGGRGLIPLTALSSSSAGSTTTGGSADNRRLSMSSIASTMSRTSSLSHQIEDLITAGALNSYI